MEINCHDIILTPEIPAEAKLTPENVEKVFDQCCMENGETGRRVQIHSRFGTGVLSKNSLDNLSGVIEQFAAQLPDIFSSDNGADFKHAKNIKDNNLKENKSWTTSNQDVFRLLSLITGIELGRVITPIYMDKYYKPSERGNFIFKIDWNQYNNNKKRHNDTYGTR